MSSRMVSCKVIVGAVGMMALLASPALGRGAGLGASAAAGNMNAGNMSAGHISSAGRFNTNGPNSTDRDTGLDRAQDRANANADLDTKMTTTGHRNGTQTTTTARTSNSNGPQSSDRDYGYDRAEDRMNSNGKANSQADTHITGTPGAGTNR
jgi:hypothetical protein